MKSFYNRKENGKKRKQKPILRRKKLKTDKCYIKSMVMMIEHCIKTKGKHLENKTNVKKS